LGARVASSTLGGFPYLQLGDGPELVVVIPGIDDAVHQFRWLPRVWAWYFAPLTTERRRVLLLSRPRGLPATVSTEALAEEYAAIIERHFGAVDLVGISMGRLIAQHLAARHGHLVRRLALVVTGHQLGYAGADHGDRLSRLATAGRWRAFFGHVNAIRFSGAHRLVMHALGWLLGSRLFGRRERAAREIVDRVAKLDLYQRTPPWVLPHPDRAVTGLERALFSALPFLQRLYRYAIYWQNEARALGFTVDPRIMNVARLLGAWNIRRQIRDPALRARVRPRYMPGCKRILMSNTYYRALARPHAEVVTSGVAEVTARGIVDESGVERPVDAIVFSTGFDVQDFLTPMRVFGRGGVELNERWRTGGVEAYRGTTIHRLPQPVHAHGPQHRSRA
jgi:pimeloyl-ACP methyl ester carboxylesterase